MADNRRRWAMPTRPASARSGSVAGLAIGRRLVYTCIVNGSHWVGLYRRANSRANGSLTSGSVASSRWPGPELLVFGAAKTPQQFFRHNLHLAKALRRRHRAGLPLTASRRSTRSSRWRRRKSLRQRRLRQGNSQPRNNWAGEAYLKKFPRPGGHPPLKAIACLPQES